MSQCLGSAFQSKTCFSIANIKMDCLFHQTKFETRIHMKMSYLSLYPSPMEKTTDYSYNLYLHNVTPLKQSSICTHSKHGSIGTSSPKQMQTQMEQQWHGDLLRSVLHFLANENTKCVHHTINTTSEHSERTPPIYGMPLPWNMLLKHFVSFLT